MQTKEIVGVKQLRQNLAKYITQVAKGRSFTVVRNSKAVFNINPVDFDNEWEEVVDFTKIKKGGVDINDVLSRI